MKTYFMAWQSDFKRGHCICDAPDDMKPQEVLKEMLDSVVDDFKARGTPIVGNVSAAQFNTVA